MVAEAVIKPSSFCHQKNNDDGTAFELYKNDAVMTNR
tara:strand:- start:968 stop:1078 length:111 start_codon:yes stop_codon:yes gene_type:complete